MTALIFFHPHTWVMNKFYILRSNWTPKLIIIFGFDLWRVGYDCVNNFSFKLNFAQFFFSFCEIYAYIFSISAQVCSDPMISLKILASFLVSTMSSYLAFGHSFDWSYHFVFIQGWCHFILVIHFWSYHLFHTGMVPFSF